MKSSILIPTIFVVALCHIGCVPPPDYPAEEGLREPVVNSSLKPLPRPTIYPLDAGIFVVELNNDLVWDGLIDTLMHTYILELVNPASGIVTTAWNTYYFEEKLFRNKISIRVQRRSRGSTQLTILNKIEQLEGNPAKNSAIWLPAEDSVTESARVILNLALALNQPSPALPMEWDMAQKRLKEDNPNIGR